MCTQNLQSHSSPKLPFNYKTVVSRNKARRFEASKHAQHHVLFLAQICPEFLNSRNKPSCLCLLSS